MKTNSPLEMGTTFRAGALSSLLALASAGISLGQEPLELENLEIFRPQDEPWLVTFNAEIDQQYIVYSSIDLECWGYAGACFELDLGDYQFVDQALLPPSKQFFIFETFDPEVTLPPQLEQLRMELGDEQFAQWLEQNAEETGNRQGVSEDQVEELPEDQREQFEQIEDVLDRWLKDFLNEPLPVLPGFELPLEFEEVRLEWGDYDLARLLVQNQDQFGNFHGICPPIVIEWEELELPVYFEFQTEEQMLGQWLENYLIELPPILLEDFEPQPQPLPPHLEQLRQELGDEGFAGWLQRNREQFGSLQGVNEEELPEEAREQYREIESILEAWLTEFEKLGVR